MKSYYIGLDGGGSNTVAAISDEVAVLYEQTFPATNYHNVGIESVKAVLKVALETLTERVGIEVKDLTGLCLGGAGIDTPEDEAIMRKAFLEVGYEGKLLVVNDALTALVGATGQEEGAVLISGTGSIALGLHQGQMVRVGGWGHIIGDEGSGYSLSRDAFREVAKFADGRKTKTKLFDAMCQTFGFKVPEDMIGFLYSEKAGKDAVASLTPKILALYGEDQAATEIIDSNISDLVDMILALSEKLMQKEFKLAVAGSVLTKSERYYALFNEALNKVLPEVDVFKAIQHPVHGAVYLSKKL